MTRREELLSAAILSLIAEGIAVLLFFAAAFVWLGVLSGRI